MELNVTMWRSWSAVLTDTLYGLLSVAIFQILIPELLERDALTRLEGFWLGGLFAVLAGVHLVTAGVNTIALVKPNLVSR